MIEFLIVVFVAFCIGAFIHFVSYDSDDYILQAQSLGFGYAKQPSFTIPIPGSNLVQVIAMASHNFPFIPDEIEYDMAMDCYILHKKGMMSIKVTSQELEEMKNGKYRRAAQANQSDPAGGANQSAGGANPSSPAAGGGLASAGSVQAALQAGAGNSLGALGAYQSALAQQQQQIQYLQQVQAYYNSIANMGPSHFRFPKSLTLTGPKPPHEPTKLKSEAIVVGEITAWRAWQIESGQQWGDNLRLMAMAAGVEWKPGEVMEGDAAGGFGIHAFKSKLLLWREYCKHFAISGKREYNLMRDEVISYIYAYGEVLLWGDIIEHNDGYRASHAKIKSIACSDFEIEAKLREIYGVGGPSE